MNPDNIGFCESINSEIYVDKSELIKTTNALIGTKRKFICVSRPRRFGKSMAAEMLSAYYNHSEDASELFAGLKISRSESYREYINKYDVIKVNMQEFLSRSHNVEELIDRVKKLVMRDLLKDKVCIYLSYMTGILPIKKYGTHSALNMFDEFSMIGCK